MYISIALAGKDLCGLGRTTVGSTNNGDGAFHILRQFINSTGYNVVEIEEIVFLNLVIAAVVYGLEKMYFTKGKNRQKIKYDKIELLKPKYIHLLYRDLSLRLGKEVIEVKTENVNFIEGFGS